MKEIKSEAKINTFLAIKEKRNDGYHNIYTTILKIPFLYDRIIIHQIEKINAKESETNIRYLGEFGAQIEEEDLITKTIKNIEKEYHLKLRIEIDVYKNIPVGGGLGGGSSNSASILKIIYQQYLKDKVSPKRYTKTIAKIGSDIPAFLNESKFILAMRKGDYTIPLPLNISLFIVIVFPDIKISTAWAYSNLPNNIYSSERKKDIKALLKKHITNFTSGIQGKIVGINDFEEIIFLNYPELYEIKEIAYNYSSVYSLLSGSGSSIYALFVDKESATNFYNYMKAKYYTIIGNI